MGLAQARPNNMQWVEPDNIYYYNMQWVEPDNNYYYNMQWVEVEERLLAMDVPIPVYFATETDELADIHTKMAAGADSEWGSSAAAGEMIIVYVSKTALLTIKSQ